MLPTAALIRACQRGVQVRITLDGRPRTPRANEAVIRMLRRALGGVSIRRVVHPDGLPMHAKFALVDGRGERRVVFGSFNWTEPSRRFNREIGVIVSNAQLFGSFEERWKVLRDSCAESPGH